MGDPFYCIFIIKIQGKRGILIFFSTNLQEILKKTEKLLFRKGETRFQNAETRFQNAETR